MPFDLDELAEIGDAVERDRVAVEGEELPLLLDDGRRLEAQTVEHRRGAVAVGDDRLVFLPRLRVRVDQRALVGEYRSFGVAFGRVTGVWTRFTCLPT